MRWRDSYPSAVRCLLADRESLTVYLRFPREHWTRVRHSTRRRVSPKVLHDLRRTLLEPPAQLRSRGEPPASENGREQPAQPAAQVVRSA